MNSESKHALLAIDGGRPVRDTNDFIIFGAPII